MFFARSHLLLWRIALWAKSRGCRTLHLGGNNPTRAPADGGRDELTRFKTRFGATAAEYVGDFDYPASPRLYAAWTRLLPVAVRLRRALIRRGASRRASR